MTMEKYKVASLEELQDSLIEIEGDMIDAEDSEDYEEILFLRQEKNLIIKRINELKATD